jgi:hypothetical protein
MHAGNNNGSTTMNAEQCCKPISLPTLSAQAIYMTHVQEMPFLESLGFPLKPLICSWQLLFQLYKITVISV